jgi:PleD family two-component response regulator
MLKNIKSIAHLSNCKVFMYSTTSETSVLEKSKTLGATDFIVKPVSPAVLKETLSEILNN